MRKPRTFNHKPVYTDERSERLAAVESRARCELGLSDRQAQAASQLHGAFAAARRQRRGRGVPVSVHLLLSAVLLLAAILLLIAFSK